MKPTKKKIQQGPDLRRPDIYPFICNCGTIVTGGSAESHKKQTCMKCSKD